MKLAIIGAGFIGKIIAQQAAEMGVETHCFAWENGAVAKDVVDYFYSISVTEKDAILKECIRIGVDGVIAAASVAIVTAAYVAQKMGLNGNPIEVAEVIGDKYRNREVTKGVPGLSEIPFHLVRRPEDVESMEFPIVLKPIDAGGKIGLSVMKKREDMEDAFRYAEESGHKKLIAEEFLEGGREYSVESLSFHGKHYILQITDKVSGGPPHCVELSHHQPANLEEDMRKQAETVVAGILTAVGIENGPCHTEIKIVDGKIYLIEVNGRLGGGHISHPLVELSTGYPYIKGVIQVALDCLEPIETDRFLHNYASVFFVTKQTEYLKPVFDCCEKYDWCYRKHVETHELIILKKNDGYRMNYFIYYSKDKPPKFLLSEDALKQYMEESND